MGKILVILSFFTFCSCSDQPRVTEIKQISYLVNQQNSDGSWGDNNKIHCTSIMLLTYLSNGETPTSKLYGKSVINGIKFLINQKENLTNQELRVSIWALSETYSMTGLTNIENYLIEIFPKFQKSLFWDYKEAPEEFFIQSLAVRCSYAAGIDNPSYKEYSVKLNSLRDHNSFALIASQSLWGKYLKLNMATEKLISKSILNYQNSPIQDCMLSSIVLLNSKPIKSRSLQQKLDHYLNEERTYRINSRFSENEKTFLAKAFPAFIFSATFPISYLPTSTLQINSKGLKESDLDLVD